MEPKGEDSQEHQAVVEENSKVPPLVESKPQTKPCPPTTALNRIQQNHYHENTNAGDKQTYRCCITSERLNYLRAKVENAIIERKTFTIKGGYHCIRNALVQRGWVEKIEARSLSPSKNGYNPGNLPSIEDICTNLPPKLEWESPAAHIAKCEKMIISRLLQLHDVDFYWNLRKDSNEWQHRLNKTKIINRFSRSLFTSKEGLCLLLQQLYWHNEPGVSYVRFPRCYTINFADQCTAFVEDFRLTACISLLKWFVTKIQNNGEFSVCTSNGRVPISSVQFAIDRCNEYVNVQKHLDIDREFHKVWDHEWDQFLTNFSSAVQKNEIFEEHPRFNVNALENSAKITLKNIIQHWPQFELDGFRNVWIMKPGNKCRGRDIRLIKDVNEVLRVMNSKLKYVVQKYIERPLLIYKTKFDIRQWFMVTCVQPLTIWMYRDCYLRFSSKTFSLDDFHESVHLTNHAVQHKYTNAERDKALPQDNMWDNHTFKAYLRQIGQAEKWYKVIYPGMRESIIGSMLASQETMDRRPNTFELYGADFMIAENYTPWLIEINSCPAMGPTTSVTARMCPQCFEDVVKVVVDRRRDPKADTGLFEMIYKQNLPQSPAYLGMTLSVRGRKLFKKRHNSTHRPEKQEPVEIKNMPLAKQKLNIELVKDYKGPIIGNLIEEIHDSLFKKEEKPNKTSPCPSPVPSPPLSPRTDTAARKLQQEKRNRVQDFQTKRSSFLGLSKHSNKKRSFPNRVQSSQKESVTKRKSVSSSGVRTSYNTNSHVKKSPKSANQCMRSMKSYEYKIWEQETASILKNSLCLSTSTLNVDAKGHFHKKELNSVTTDNNLPGIRITNGQFDKDLLTRGFGYKTFAKENILSLHR